MDQTLKIGNSNTLTDLAKTGQGLLNAGSGNSNVPSTLTFDNINGATPSPTPPITNHATTLNSLVASTIQPVTDASGAVDKASGEVTSTTNDLSALIASLGGQTADQNAAESATGLPTLNKELLDLQNTARQQGIEYATTPYSMQGQGRGITTGILRGQEAVKQRQVGIDLLVTNSNIQAKMGNIVLAQNLADKAVAAKYDPIKQSIEAKKFLLTSQYQNLSRADKKLADEKQKQWDLKLKEVDDTMAKEKTMSEMIIDATAQGAPNSVIKSAQDLINKGATPAQVAVAIGKYSGAAAKAELLREQIKTEKAQQVKLSVEAAKIRSEMNGSSDKLLTIDEATKLGVPYGTTQKQAIAITSGSSGKPAPLNAVQIQAQKSAEALLDSLNKDFGHFFQSEAPVGFNSIFGTIPGTKRRDFSVNYDNLKSLLSLDNVKLLKGQGAVSDAERQLLADASSKLNRSQSLPEFKKTLENIVTTFNKASPEYQYVDSIVGHIDTTANALTPSASAYANSLLAK